MADRVFIVPPTDKGRDWKAARAAMREVCAMADEGKPVEVRVRFWKRSKTSPQNATLWMWFTEVASQLTQRCRESGINTVWTKDEVYEQIFLPRHMPMKSSILPDGELVFAPMRLSDKGCTAEAVSGAMEAFLAWVYEGGFEVTIPESHEVTELMRGPE